MKLMSDIRQSIREDRFPQFIRDFFLEMYPTKKYPEWAVDALDSVGVHLNDEFIQ